MRPELIEGLTLEVLQGGLCLGDFMSAQPIDIAIIVLELPARPCKLCAERGGKPGRQARASRYNMRFQRIWHSS